MPGSRRLLARLRDVMAGSGSPQERLDNIVTTIAMDFVAEVCSVYVLRAGEVLELFAATGLSRGQSTQPGSQSVKVSLAPSPLRRDRWY